MGKFKEAVDIVFRQEGGWVDNSKDLGGATNFGISLRFLQSIDKTATIETIKNLTKEQAEDLYFTHFFLPHKYDFINSQAIVNKVFSTAVNMSSKVANRFLQQALNIAIFNGKKLVEDGIIGKNTIDTINLLDGEDVEEHILRIYSLLQKEYYAKIVIARPEQLTFLKGWFNRASE